MAKVPPAFHNELYAALATGPSTVFCHDLPEIVGLGAGHIADLITPGVELFPKGRCDPMTGRIVWNRKRLVAWRWAIHQDNWLAEAVDYWLCRTEIVGHGGASVTEIAQ